MANRNNKKKNYMLAIIYDAVFAVCVRRERCCVHFSYLYIIAFRIMSNVNIYCTIVFRDSTMHRM